MRLPFYLIKQIVNFFSKIAKKLSRLCLYTCINEKVWLLMYSPEFMRILVGSDKNEATKTEQEKELKSESKKNVFFRIAKYATVPIEIKNIH